MNKDKLLEKYYSNPTPEDRALLIEEMVPLIKLVCGRLSVYTTGILDMEDLCQYGVFGLIDAIDKYSPDMGVKFETYASYRIRGAVLDEVRKMDMIPRTVRQKEKELKKAKQQLASSGIFDRKSLAELVGIPEEDIDAFEADLARWDMVWIDALEGEDGDNSDSSALTPVSQLGNPEDAIKDISMEELKGHLAEALTQLTDGERRAVTLFYYEEMSQAEIAEVMEVSPSRVSQLVGHGLNKLKKLLGPYSELFCP